MVDTIEVPARLFREIVNELDQIIEYTQQHVIDMDRIHKNDILDYRQKTIDSVIWWINSGLLDEPTVERLEESLREFIDKPIDFSYPSIHAGASYEVYKEIFDHFLKKSKEDYCRIPKDKYIILTKTLKDIIKALSEEIGYCNKELDSPIYSEFSGEILRYKENILESLNNFQDIFRRWKEYTPAQQ